MRDKNNQGTKPCIDEVLKEKGINIPKTTPIMSWDDHEAERIAIERAFVKSNRCFTVLCKDKE